VIWRILTGAPPGGVERELRRIGERERPVRPVFAAVLVIVGIMTVAVDPVLGLLLVGTFAIAGLMQRKLD
jgi:hypothetical protein